MGLEWNATKPKGTLADAIKLQTAAHSAYESAGKARDDYERAAMLQAQAIEKRATMPHYPDGTTPVATAADSDYNYDLEVKKGNAAWGEVNALSAEADAAYKSGDKNLTDLMVTSNGSVAPPSGTSAPSDKPVEIKVGDDTLLVSADVAKAYGEKGITALTESNGSVGVQVGDKTIQVSPDVAKAYTEQGISALTESTKPIGVQVDITHSDGTVTTEWRWVEPQLAFLKIESDGALKLSQAYAAYYGEASRLADFEVQKTELANEAIANQKELAPHQFDPEGFTDLEGDHSGKLQSVNVFDRDGQLVLEIQYEDKRSRSGSQRTPAIRVRATPREMVLWPTGGGRCGRTRRFQAISVYRARMPASSRPRSVSMTSSRIALNLTSVTWTSRSRDLRSNRSRRSTNTALARPNHRRGHWLRVKCL